MKIINVYWGQETNISDPHSYERYWTRRWNKTWKKKIQARTGFEPMTSAISVQTFNCQKILFN